VPAIYASRQHVASGGLMAYGADQPHQFRDGATYVDRILRGVARNEGQSGKGDV
jgi:putative tryptophan/tyrosine transport system substrate-binding protein